MRKLRHVRRGVVLLLDEGAEELGPRGPVLVVAELDVPALPVLVHQLVVLRLGSIIDP